MALINIDSLLMRTKNRRPVVIAVPVLVGLFAGGLLIVKPALKNLTTLESEIGSLKEKEAPYNFIVLSEQKLDAHKARFSGKDKTWLIEQLNTIAEETGFSIVSISPEEQKKLGDFLQQTSVRIDAKADYHRLGEFVSRVESLEPYVKVLVVNIAAGAENDTAQTRATGPRARIMSGHDIGMSVGLLTLASDIST